jgi:hypothetical protein
MSDHEVGCIHIGLPKTATTTLQDYLYPFHSQVFYLGKYYPPKPFFLNPDVERVINGIRDPRRDDGRLPELRDVYRRTTAAALQAGKVPIWSDELEVRVSHAHLRSKARAFRAIFGPCKVLITVRQPISFVKSLYLHLLTSYQIERERWLSETVRRGYAQKPVFASLEQWLERTGFKPKDESQYGVANMIDIGSLAEIFAESFGAERVGIFLFEQMVEDMPAFVSELSGFLGIDGSEAHSRIEGHRSTQRVSQRTVERLRAICDSPFQMTAFRFGPQWLRNRMTGIGTARNGDQRAEITVPPVWRERIEDVARESHGRLLRRWPLPLERYGYPV